jgi:hypothetical protein
LLTFQNWHYVLPTQPAMVVIDTRTRRWRSEMNLKQPSGLLDWEALCELQQELLDHPCAIIVSPAPIFGVKLIETVQRVFSWCGYPLLVDAENWMAHRGAAQVILNIFRHSRTPANYVVLSGDVHYSFVYEVLIRHRKAGPHIWQITSSGIKNEFPRALLEWFDRLNRWLYSPRSPLNWLTKRRRMRIVPYVPEHAEAGERLWNSAGIGQVFFNDQGQPRRSISTTPMVRRRRAWCRLPMRAEGMTAARDHDRKPVGASLLAMDPSAPRLTRPPALSLTTIATVRRFDRLAPTMDRVTNRGDANWTSLEP